MDLIYTNAEGIDQGVLKNFKLDEAYGSDENSLEITLYEDILELGCLIYAYGEEVGGIIDSKSYNTAEEKYVYSGRTWTGILNSKVVEPPANEDYYVINNQYMRDFIPSFLEKIALKNFFRIVVTSTKRVNYTFDRYTLAYDGLSKLLKGMGYKLKIIWQNKKPSIYVEDVIRYENDSIMEASFMEMDLDIVKNTVNHLVCLGKGELKARQVLHLYVGEDGSISKTQYYTGSDEYTAVYDYSAVESMAELEKGGIERLKELSVRGTASGTLTNSDIAYDVGDIVTASDEKTGTIITSEIKKKIITMTASSLMIEYSIK